MQPQFFSWIPNNQQKQTGISSLPYWKPENWKWTGQHIWQSGQQFFITPVPYQSLTNPRDNWWRHLWIFINQQSMVRLWVQEDRICQFKPLLVYWLWVEWPGLDSNPNWTLLYSLSSAQQSQLTRGRSRQAGISNSSSQPLELIIKRFNGREECFC